MALEQPAELALEEAMGNVAQRYPDDKEATILHSLVLSATFDPADRQFTRQLRAAKTLEPLFTAQPNHPGVAHYLIHSYDYPPIAQHGLEAAKRYSKIAPDAPHALHMPSHIFSRVGYWRDSIEANRASAKVSLDGGADGPHARDYLVYAHLQLGQDRAAQQVIEEANKQKRSDSFPAAYAYAAMPARYAIERGDWKTAAQVPLQPAADQYAWKKYPQAEAINAFARGIGAAKSGDAQAALKESQRLQTLRDDLGTMKLAYWVEQVDIQAEQVRGLALCAEGKAAAAIRITEELKPFETHVKRVMSIRNRSVVHNEHAISRSKVYQVNGITPNQLRDLIDAACSSINGAARDLGIVNTIFESDRVERATLNMLETLQRGRA